MKADLSFVHRLFVCEVLCGECGFCVCGFLARIIGADFWCGFFGADFSVRIFRCGFFGVDFSVRIFARIFVRFFCGFFFCTETAGRATKKIQQKIHQKILPKILPKISSPKIPPQILPKSLSGHSPVGPHLDSKEVRVRTLMPLWRLAAKVIVFLATGVRG